jgi:FtsH-binding integral membrane protein
MNSQQYPTSLNNVMSPLEQEEIQRGFITRVYGWMTFGLFVTAAAALMTWITPGVQALIFSTPLVFGGLLIGELALVIGLSAAINRLNPAVASLLFIGYAGLNGVTLSVIMLIYTASSIAVTFGIAACTFGIMTLFGYTTHRDLTKLGSLLIMALLGLILASVVNLFIANTAIYWITTYVGVLIFTGLIAYDTQKLKNMSLVVSANGEAAQKASIVGALALYLDFINLFLMLLRIFGRRK